METQQRIHRPHWVGIVLTLAPIFAATWLLYGASLRLPFFSDDIAHFQWVGANSLIGLWKSAAGIGYFRPLVFTLWKISVWVNGRFDPLSLHAAMVFLHILNTTLVIRLARRIATGPYRSTIAFGAGALFLVYPFSYQVVPYVGAMFHPVATALALAALVLTEKPIWWREGVALLLSAAACLAHEVGIGTGVIWLVRDILHGRDKPYRDRTLLWPIAACALGVLYTFLYLRLPRLGAPPKAPNTAQLVQNGAYLLQGWAFPIAPLLRGTIARWGWSDLQAVYVATGITTTLLGTLSWQGRQARTFVFGLAGFIIAIAPSWLALPVGYVLSGPRLLYLGSAFVSITWSSALVGLTTWGGRHWRAAAKGLALALFALCVCFGIRFVRERFSIYHIGGELIWESSRILEASPSDERYLVVNWPAWGALETLKYPLGHEGVEFLPLYAGVGDLIWINTGANRRIETVKFSNVLHPIPGLMFGIRGPEVGWEELSTRLHTSDRVYVVDYTTSKLHLRYVGRLLSTTSSKALATFDGRLSLVDATVLPLQPEEPQAITRSAIGYTTKGWSLRLVWTAPRRLDDADYRVFAHLITPSGVLITQADGYPMGGLYPFWLWQPGDIVEDIRYLLLPADVEPGPYRITVGVYDPATTRLVATIPDQGTRAADDAVPVATVP